MRQWFSFKGPASLSRACAGGDNGFSQAIELSADMLANVKFVQVQGLVCVRPGACEGLNLLSSQSMGLPGQSRRTGHRISQALPTQEPAHHRRSDSRSRCQEQVFPRVSRLLAIRLVSSIQALGISVCCHFWGCHGCHSDYVAGACTSK